MPVLRFGGKSYEARDGETVLECLLRSGVSVEHSCRQGICQSCLLKVTQGEVAAEAQGGLKPAWRALGYVLSCRMRVHAGLALESVGEALSVRALITRVEPLAALVVRVLVRTRSPFHCEPGQFVQLVRADGLARPYSVASATPHHVELHVAVRAHRGMSRWLANEAGSGTEVTLKGPYGECFYLPGRPEEKLLLAATGTGIAPLTAIVRSALTHRHTGPIWLYHGSSTAAGLYLWEELRTMGAQHGNVKIAGCVGANELQLSGVTVERLEQRLRADHPQLSGTRVFLCGNPETVRALKKYAYLAGASLESIHSDPFIAAPPAA